MISSLSDDEFLARFEAGHLPASEFHHEDHVRATWLCIARYGEERATEAVANGIRAIATAHGIPERYHETITTVWVRLIAHHRALHPTDDFESFYVRAGGLADQRLLERRYSREVLFGPVARSSFVEPDLRPLPVG